VPVETLLRVLVVDDSTAVRERLRLHVDDVDGVQVVGEAGDGHQAVALLETADPHVVVLDLRMPGLNGFGTLKEIKARDPSRTVIVMTNYAYPQYRQRCLEDGADFFLDKSTDFPMLRQILADLARRPREGPR
jgi:DNA-binding NarL/FixJ family response regulator